MTAEPTTAIDVIGHIVRTPGVVGGKPRIAGGRIRVMDVVVWYELQGQSVAEILDEFPQLSAADVHAALAYYHDNREEIDEALERAQRFAEEFEADNPSLVFRPKVG
jgi:uncharacterized protein (DUF433 family)